MSTQTWAGIAVSVAYCALNYGMGVVVTRLLATQP